LINLKDFIIGLIIGIFIQVVTFFQLQGPIRWLSWNKYYWLLVLAGIPISMVWMYYAKIMTAAFGGAVWPQRLIGFAIGAIVFAIGSWLIFKEPVTIKTIICLIMAISIVIIQVFWK